MTASSRVAAVHLVLIVLLRRMAGLVKLQCSIDLVSERQQWAERASGSDHVFQGRRVPSRAELAADQAAKKKELFPPLLRSAAVMRPG
jgi:hypothetical protein